MSRLSEKAMELFVAGRREEASQIARSALRQDSDDWHAHYILGMCLRFEHDYPQACLAISRANDLAPNQTFVLLALSIARQLNGDYPAAIDAIRVALEVNPDYAVGYNTLAMTQKLMGAYDKAAHNYDQGARAMARTIARSLNNAETSPRLSHWDSRNSLWVQYALNGAVYIAAEAGADDASFPTDELAALDARTGQFAGWYWKDEIDEAQKRAFRFLPNFFNTFSARLRADGLYATLVGNRSTVLQLMNNTLEADQHRQEAEDFTP